ncbi:MAG: CHAT domain-containing protein [Steroidobacteraceae bacterium]|nr:CHAT domain-containing protein [Steroidobacteraceae bacterium]
MPPVSVAPYVADFPVAAGASVSWERNLAAGAYLIESRETEVDIRMIVDTPERHAELDDETLRHGEKKWVVTLNTPGKVRVTLRNVDHQTMKGAATLRVIHLRDIDDPPAARELGFGELGAAGELLALRTPAAREKSRENLRAAIGHFTADNDLAARADAHYALADVEYFVRTDYPAGVAEAEAARSDYAAVGDLVGIHDAISMRAKIEIEIAWLMNAAGKRAEQLAMFRSIDEQLRIAEAFYAARGMHVHRAFLVNLRGVAVLYSGVDDGAAEIFEEAIAVARKNNDALSTAMYLANVAWTHHRMGFLQQSAREQAELLGLADWSRHPTWYAQWLSNYGNMLSALGEFDRALAVQTEAHEIFEAEGMIHERANAMLAIGNVYFRVGDLDRSRESLASACMELEKLADYAGLPVCLRISGNVASALGRHKEALGFLRRAAQFESNEAAAGRTQILTASALRELGDLDGAREALEKGFAVDNALIRGVALEERGRLWLARHDSSRAIRDLRAADAAFAALGVDFNRIEANTALSHAMLARGDIDGAARAADVAIGIESGIRVKSTNPEWRASFLSSRYAPYEARIAAELSGRAHDPARVWRAFQIAERVRARALSDPLAPSTNLNTGLPADAEALRATLTSQLGRLESRLQRTGPDDPVAIELRRSAEMTRARLLGIGVANPASIAVSVLPESLAQLQASLPDDIAVLAFFTGDLKSDVWLLTRNELRHARTSGANALEMLVRDFVRELRADPSSRPGKKLADELLGNLLEDLGATRLVIVPDGPLNGLPFAALPLAHTRDLVVDRFTISASPSLALALGGSRAAREHPRRVAVISDPVYSLVDRRLVADVDEEGSGLRDAQSLARLPYSAVEARTVVKAFGIADTLALSGFDATAQRVLALQSEDLRVLHFATHARGSTAPERSALFLSRFASDGVPLSTHTLTADDIAHSRLRADLVILSGCATGEGRELRGGGVLGLTHGFLANGSRSVIASLWPIEDAPAARFMEEFYAAYRVSGRAAEALRIAQLRTRNGPAKAVWSSFVVRANELP